MTQRITRREGLLAGLFGSGYIGLRALATGLPTWYLLNPRRATAQDLQCAITAQQNLQYLIVSANSNGDPLNCNVPGTYEGTAATAVHPTQPEMAATAVSLGGTTYQAALPWADMAVSPGGQLSAATLARISFFHHRTGTTVHGDQPKVMKLLGDTSGGEMFVSAYAKHLSTCFGTVQAAPIAVGARGNSSELVSFGGRMLPSISPTAAQVADHRHDRPGQHQPAGRVAGDARQLAQSAQRPGQDHEQRRPEAVPGSPGHQPGPGPQDHAGSADAAQRHHERQRCRGRRLRPSPCSRPTSRPS